jgi:hypothetical protein
MYTLRDLPLADEDRDYLTTVVALYMTNGQKDIDPLADVKQLVTTMTPASALSLCTRLIGLKLLTGDARYRVKPTTLGVFAAFRSDKFAP